MLHARVTEIPDPVSQQDFCFATRLGLRLGDQGRDRGFSVMIGPSENWVATLGGVATEFGQGKEALCHDMETVSL